MKIEIKNYEVPHVIRFLDNIKFVGIKSINRTKLTRHLVTKLEEIMEGEDTIRKDFKDKPKELQKELTDYAQEKVIIEGGEFLVPLKTIKIKIKEMVAEDSTYEFNGNDSVAVAALYDAFNLGGE